MYLNRRRRDTFVEEKKTSIDSCAKDTEGERGGGEGREGRGRGKGEGVRAFHH